MLFKSVHPSGRKLVKSRPLLIQAKDGYVRPGPGPDWFQTTCSVWRIDEVVKRRVRDWRRLLGEDGHTGERAEKFRKDHDSVFTGTHSVFPAPLIEWILLRYAPAGGRILDAFAGGPPRGVVSSIMGYQYVGFEVRMAQIIENTDLLKALGLEKNVKYIHADGRFLEGDLGKFDFALTCPPYYNLETYSDQPDDISNLGTYAEFNAGMAFSAMAHFELMKPEAFVAIVVGNFRDKTGELVDFRSHTVENFRAAGMTLFQDIILSKNFGSAAQRSTNAWKGKKLVSIHEHLLLFRMPA